jgi:ion channel
MSGNFIFNQIEPVLGGIVVLLVLADVFLTVLYARIGTGILSDHIASGTWSVFKWISKICGTKRGGVLSFCGPTIVVLILFTWSFGLTLGTALIMHPHLGSGVTATSGGTPHDFFTALFIAAASITTMGTGNFAPQTAGSKLLFTFAPLVGMSVISLTVTYLMQVYTVLRQRNTLGLKLQFLSGETGDAAELLSRLGAGGEFRASYSIISEVAAEMTLLKEAHHFYPILFYFRFREPYYSVSRSAQLVIETSALIQTALSDESYRWLKESAAVCDLNRSALMLVKLLERVFLPGGVPDASEEPNESTRAVWRERFAKALRRLRAAGIETIADPEAGAEAYSSQRQTWEPFIRKLAEAGAFEWDEIEPSTPKDA